MIEWFCSWERPHAAQGEEKHCCQDYPAISAEVAVKKLLNYLRRYTKDRPTTIEVSDIKRVYRVTLEWTTVKKQGVLGIGVEGDWYNVLKVEKLSLQMVPKKNETEEWTPWYVDSL